MRSNRFGPVRPSAAPGARESFYTRWSRRKRAERDGASDADPHHPPAAKTEPAEQSPPPSAPDTAAQSPDPDDVATPDLETLDEHSDYAPLFSENISAALRKTALRKLFRSAKFNVVDELDDYNDDFRAVTLWTDSLIAGDRAGTRDAAPRPVADESPTIADAEKSREDSDSAQGRTVVTDVGEAPEHGPGVESDTIVPGPDDPPEDDAQTRPA